MTAQTDTLEPIGPLHRPAWQARANCRGLDPDIFYPTRGVRLGEVKAVCAGCVVREDCLEYALANGEKFGIWGGVSERQRRLMRKRRAAS